MCYSAYSSKTNQRINAKFTHMIDATPRSAQKNLCDFGLNIKVTGVGYDICPLNIIDAAGFGIPARPTQFVPVR